MDFSSMQDVLRCAGVQIDTGLTDREFSDVEERFAFRFPPDLREFLSIGLPTSHHWADWRGADAGVIKDRFDWPFRGMCFDIENNAFWLEEWGQKPEDLASATVIARNAYEQAPKLIPICSHRYMPGSPHEAGNPIFSVYQTDIIYYGSDLIDYLQNEYRKWFGRAEYIISGPPRKIPFWSSLAGS